MRQGETSLILPGGRNFPKEHHSSCSESRRESGRVQGEETTSDKVGITRSRTLKDHFVMQGTVKCILCWLMESLEMLLAPVNPITALQ